VFALDDHDVERQKELSSHSQFPLSPTGSFFGGVAALNCVVGF
jgi:hypothetical protein